LHKTTEDSILRNPYHYTESNQGTPFFMRRFKILNILCISLGLVFAQQLTFADEIYVGTSSADISPQLPVALMGQFNLRVAKTADNPLYAGVVAIESRKGAQKLDTAIFVSCDLVFISEKLREELRAEVKKLIPGFNVAKIILNATHTHTAPVLENDPKESSFLYPIPPDVTTPEAYRKLFVKNVSAAIVKAWNSRAQGLVAWGMQREAVGYNRRVHYKNGTTEMYGNAAVPQFQNIEGYEDHDINSLYFWDSKGKLLAVSIEVACPAQEVENIDRVNADYWHPVRESLKKQFGNDLVTLGWIGAAGDQSPHTIYRKEADIRMLELANKTRMDDIAARVYRAAKETYDLVKNDKRAQVEFRHETRTLNLPMRIITPEENEESLKVSQDCAAQIKLDPGKAKDLMAKMTWFADVNKRYAEQQKNPNPTYASEIHVLRIGDIAICTNQFELFTDFGIRMQARSKALQTFVIQLAGPGTYLPTHKAMAAGGYSAVCQSSVVSPEGGQMLVDESLTIIDSMWK
jgi:hypothetical protein